MWTYDGESWIDESSHQNDEGQSNGEIKRPNQTSRFEEFYPELQVVEVEITPVTPRTNRRPLLPIP
jgi:hypothetical protein